MSYLKIKGVDYSSFVSGLKVDKSFNYNAQTNAAGNTLIDLINSKRSVEATIIPLHSDTMATLQEALNSFKCQISFLNPQTKQLTTINTIVSDVKVEYYTIQDSKTLYKAFTITFKEL